MIALIGSQLLSTKTKHGWIKLNVRHSSMSCAIFRTGMWITHVIRGGYLVVMGTMLVTPALQ